MIGLNVSLASIYQRHEKAGDFVGMTVERENLTQGSLTDKELADRARYGDQEAFGELIRRHRAKVFGWASTLANDSFLAEDIVQDALIRAFLHIGQLLDTDRFVPWLQSIVRNQAYMKLRRGGPYRKEKPFSS